MPLVSPKVFISYRHESPEHKARVLSFASRLVTEGVDVSLDQWVPNPAGGFALYAQQQLAQSKFVLLICTDAYRSYVENADYADGAGVFFEMSLVRNYLYSEKGLDNRFIPVYYGDTGFNSIPVILKTAPSFRIDSPAGYMDLYRLLTAQPISVRPVLGEVIDLATATIPTPVTILPRITPHSAKSQADTMLADTEATLPEDSTFSELSSLPVEDEHKHKSLEGTTITYIRFDNYLSGPVNIYWLNYLGQRESRGELSPGRSQLQMTYVTHPWIVTTKNTTGNETVIGLFEPTKDPGIAALLTAPPPPPPDIR